MALVGDKTGRPISEPRPVPVSRRAALGAAIGLAFGAGVFALSSLWLFQAYELRTLDWRQRALGRRTPSVDRVALVLVDEYSVEREREEASIFWPWPRDMYVPILRFLEKAGVRAVAFDIVFADPHKDRTDAEFAAAIAEAGNVTLAAKLDGWPRDPEREAVALEKAAFGVEGWDHPARAGLTRLVGPLPEFAEAARGLGFVNVLQDPDNTIRRADLAIAYPERGKAVASLALDAARTALGRGLRARKEGRFLALGDVRIPLGRDGRALVRYYGGLGTFRTENATSVLRSFLDLEEGRQPRVPLETFRDAVVIVGANMSGMEDVVSAPMDPRFLGPEFQATVCANILGGEFLRELAAGERIAVLAALALLSGLAIFLAWRPAPAALAAIGILGAYGGLAFAAFRRGLVLELFSPALVVGATFVAEALVAYVAEGRRRREVAKAFGQYLSPEVIRELLRNPEALKLGGETRRIAVAFSDIRGFSTFSEGMTPEELVSFLNVYLTAMTDIVLERRGVIDKYEGDAIMAFWGAPISLERPALHAALAALEERRALQSLNERFRAEGRPPLAFRLGLAFGPAVVGNMGSTRRFAYTAMGDTVNLASRLEGANKFFGTALLASEAAVEDAGEEIVARRLGKVLVVGKKIPTGVFELVGRRGEVGAEEMRRLERHEEALRCLEQGRTGEALEAFSALLEEGEDPVAARSVAKCRELGETGRSWDGVWVLAEKG
ncbi:MAG: CHASE2 domain-containing protein [Planctomycetota bacterium]